MSGKANAAAASAQERGRFWGADGSGSESDSGSGSGSEDTREEKPKVAAKPAKRFVDLESDSESDDEKRVVRTAKDKKWDQLLTIIAAVRNQLRINNWVAIEEGE